MSIEALWAVRFGVRVNNQPEQWAAGGGGVVVCETERLFGGDTSFAYVGEYAVSNNTVTANCHVWRHGPGLPAALGVEDAHVTLQGTLDTREMILAGTVAEIPGITVVVHFRRIAELP